MEGEVMELKNQDITDKKFYEDYLINQLNSIKFNQVFQLSDEISKSIIESTPKESQKQIEYQEEHKQIEQITPQSDNKYVKLVKQNNTKIQDEYMTVIENIYDEYKKLEDKQNQQQLSDQDLALMQKLLELAKQITYDFKDYTEQNLKQKSIGQKTQEQDNMMKQQFLQWDQNKIQFKQKDKQMFEDLEETQKEMVKNFNNLQRSHYKKPVFVDEVD